MRVWIDQDLCTGDGLCEDHCADAFKLLEDGIAYVAELGVALNDPGGAGSLARVGLATDKAFCVPQKFALANAFLLMSAMK